MIDFGLYCRIAEYLDKLREFSGLGDDAELLIQYLVEKDEGERAVREFICGCDRRTVLRLMDYFGPDPKVSGLLKGRLKELDGGTELAVGGEGPGSIRPEEPSFYQYLCQMIERHGFSSEAEFYKHISMSRQTFAKLRSPDASISRNHALLMTVGLRLNYQEAIEFMRHAGYVFRGSDKRECIILYVIRNVNYTLSLMEEILCSFNQRPLVDY